MEQAKKPCILIYSGNFSPITLNHIKYLEFVKSKLEENYRVDKAYLVPVCEQVLKKKFNGGAPLEDDDRKDLIEALITDVGNSWLVPFYGLLESDDPESLGWATREIIKLVGDESYTFITIMPIHKIDIVVRICSNLIRNKAYN